MEPATNAIKRVAPSALNEVGLLRSRLYRLGRVRLTPRTIPNSVARRITMPNAVGSIFIRLQHIQHMQTCQVSYWAAV